jgi:hypothetical protein
MHDRSRICWRVRHSTAQLNELLHARFSPLAEVAYFPRVKFEQLAIEGLTDRFQDGDCTKIRVQPNVNCLH